MPDFLLERQVSGLVAGVDEVGRGPWAGPVVACAVVFFHERVPEGMNDSKKLTAARREAIHGELMALRDAGGCAVGLGFSAPEEIDRINILQASMTAMRRALEAMMRRCAQPVAHALVDGNRLPALPCPATAVVGGDGRSLSIAAASIIAKVERDRMMAELARECPAYGWERNAGYGTAEHQAALKTHGVTAHHRRSFRPVREVVEALSHPQGNVLPHPPTARSALQAALTRSPTRGEQEEKCLNDPATTEKMTEEA